MINVVLLTLIYLFPYSGLSEHLSGSAIVPAVNFKYADQNHWDVYDYEEPIRIEVDQADLATLSRPRVRLFAGRYVKDVDEPVKLTIKKVNGCGIFQSRAISWKPTLAQPQILLGRLDRTDFRCVNKRITDTDFYLVIEQGGTSDSLVNVNLDTVDNYFASAYRFTVTVPPDEPCSSGTEVADRQDTRARRQNHSKYVAARRRADVEQQKIAALDTRMSCIDKVKESDAALLTLGVAVSVASKSEVACCAPSNH